MMLTSWVICCYNKKKQAALSNASVSHQNKLTFIFLVCLNLEWDIITECAFESTSIHTVELGEKQSWINFHNLPKKGKKI